MTQQITSFDEGEPEHVYMMRDPMDTASTFLKCKIRHGER